MRQVRVWLRVLFSLLALPACGAGPAPTANSAAPPRSIGLRLLTAGAQGTSNEPVAIPSASPSAIVAAPISTSSEVAPPGMLLVAGGEFTMGAPSGGEPDEHPAHRVTVKSFWLDTDEVTVAQYTECVVANLCRPYKNNYDHAGKVEARFRQPSQPVSGISWDDAVAYCGFRGKRLPREAEWERAARGDDDRTYPWGNTQPEPTVHGCFARPLGTESGTTCIVGSYPKGNGPYGHHDLAGNVWEWQADYYDPFAYRRATAASGEPASCEEILETQDFLRSHQQQGYTGSNPIPTTCERVLRGGAFNYPGPGLRTTNRVHHPGNWRLLMAGVRCAKDQEIPGQSEESSAVTPPQ